MWRRSIKRLHIPSPAPILALGCLAAITIAEALTSFGNPRAGMALYCALLAALVIGAGFLRLAPARCLLLGVSLAPMVRISSLALPLGGVPPALAALAAGIPPLAAGAVVVYSAGLSRQQIGLQATRLHREGLLGSVGLLLGPLLYLAQRQPPAGAPSLSALWAPMLALAGVGVIEEVLFRGIMQATAVQALGRPGILLPAALYAVLMGSASLFVGGVALAIGLLFGWIVQRRSSIVGVALAHALLNAVFILSSAILR